LKSPYFIEYNHVQQAKIVDDTLFSSWPKNILPQIKDELKFQKKNTEELFSKNMILPLHLRGPPC
jgi:hypothetical protein